MFERGAFSMASRATNLAYKVSHFGLRCQQIPWQKVCIACVLIGKTPWLLQGMVFALVGFAAGIVGTSLSNGLLAIRQRLDPTFKSQNKPPNILLNAGTWATHMGVSSNFRYQLLNGMDMVGF